MFLEGATLLLKMRWAFVLRYLYFFMLTRHARQRREEHFENDSENLYENNLLPHLVSLLALSLPSQKRSRGPRNPNEDRNSQKRWLILGYATWTGHQFRNRLRITRPVFEFLLGELEPHLTKTPTNAVPNPIEGN